MAVLVVYFMNNPFPLFTNLNLILANESGFGYQEEIGKKILSLIHGLDLMDQVADICVREILL